MAGALALAGWAVACDGADRAAPPAAAARAAPGRAIDPPAAAGALAPNLAAAADRPVLSWLEPMADGGHRLLVSRFTVDGWGAPAVVAEGGDFFANWADLPAVAEAGDGSLVAHWLAKTAAETYAYSVFLARSLDGGASWSPFGRLNDDDTPAEHGFVSWVRDGDGLRAFWLDGREMPAGGAMGLRTAAIGASVGASELLDERVCECCATDTAGAAAGPLVVYRDRGLDEVRDISVVRRADGGWAVPRPAAADGWTIHGCPVNGPAVAARGDLVAVAWFTGAGEAPRVQVAFSEDGGAAFGPPLAIDATAPLGRVDLVLDGAGGAIVAWLATAGDAAAVSLRRAGPGGALGDVLQVDTTGAARASGFPRLLRLAENLYLAWVDTTPEAGQRIRVRELRLADVPTAAAP